MRCYRGLQALYPCKVRNTCHSETSHFAVFYYIYIFFHNKQVLWGRAYSQFTFWKVKPGGCIYTTVQQQPVDKRKKSLPIMVRFWSFLKTAYGTVSGSLCLCQQFPFSLPVLPMIWSTKPTRLLLWSFLFTKLYGSTGTVISSRHARKGKPCQKKKLNMKW